MGKITVHNLAAVPPGQIQLCNVIVGDAVLVKAVNTSATIRKIQAGIYVRCNVNISGFEATSPAKWSPFMHLTTGEVRMLPTWINGESVDLTVNFRKAV